MEDTTRVLFRKFGVDVVALMPDIPHDIMKRLCMSYSHVGQHGAADLDYVMQNSREATEKEATPLREELLRIGYVIAP